MYLSLGLVLTRNAIEYSGVIFFVLELKFEKSIAVRPIEEGSVCVQVRKRTRSRNTRSACVLPGAPRPAADSFYQRRTGGYRPWHLLGELAPPQSPSRLAATRIQRSNFRAKSSPGRCSCGLGGTEGCKTGFATALIFLRRRRRSTLCWGPSGLGRRPFRWPCLSRFMDLASEAVDDKAQVCVVCFGFMGHATSSWTNYPN